MLSILVPVYNFNIVPLVTKLHTQATRASIPFEIIILDDCSSELLRDQNKDVGNLKNVRFYELDKNIGRARIRNRLAELARYPSLLFMDCDSEVPTERYIENYLSYCNKEMVVCGGRIYRDDPPEETEYMLRWLYGVNIEQKNDIIRNKAPYRSFMTNNFLIAKSILMQIQFDESIIQYGHEDTLFGLELKKRDIPVTHIQNPLIHIGLEVNREFLRKTSESIENLLMLVYDNKIHKEDFKDIRLIRAYGVMSKYHLVRIYLLLYSLVTNAVIRNLMGSNPSIFAFHLYKLYLMSKLIKKGKEEIFQQL